MKVLIAVLVYFPLIHQLIAERFLCLLELVKAKHDWLLVTNY